MGGANWAAATALSNMSLSNKELWEQGKEMMESLGIHNECPQGDDLFQD